MADEGERRDLPDMTRLLDGTPSAVEIETVRLRIEAAAARDYETRAVELLEEAWTKRNEGYSPARFRPPDRFEQECGLGNASQGHTVLQRSCSYLQPGVLVVWPGG